MSANSNVLPYTGIVKRGVFRPGWKRNAEGQVKKKADQMSKQELEYLVYLIRDISSFRIHEHLLKKKERGLITFDILTIQRMFHSRKLPEQIREYSETVTHDGRVDHRVLIRSNKKEKVFIQGKGNLWCNLIFVLSLDTREIITAYYVHKNHRFTQVNEDRYSKDLLILKQYA